MLALALVFSLNAITCSSSCDGFYSTLHAGSTFFRHFTVIRLASSLDAWNALQHAGCSARAAAGVGRRTPEQKRHFYSTPGCVVYTKNPSRATLPAWAGLLSYKCSWCSCTISRCNWCITTIYSVNIQTVNSIIKPILSTSW